MYFFFFRFHIHTVSCTLSLCVCLTSLSVTASRSVHVAAEGTTAFSSKAAQCPLRMDHLFLECSSAWTSRLFPCAGYREQRCYEHRGPVYLLQRRFPPGPCPGAGLLGHVVALLRRWRCAHPSAHPPAPPHQGRLRGWAHRLNGRGTGCHFPKTSRLPAPGRYSSPVPFVQERA